MVKLKKKSFLFEGTLYHYDFVREFSCDKNKDKDSEPSRKVFFILRPNRGAVYNPLDTKYMLRRKRAKIF